LLSAIAFAAGFWVRSQATSQFPSALLARIEENLATEYAAIDREAELLRKDSVTFGSALWDELEHVFVRTDSSGVTIWNRNQYIPEPVAWRSQGALNFYSNQRGEFLLKKWPVTGGYLVNILVLRDRYPITNAFLISTLNANIFPVKELDIVGATGSIGAPIHVADEPVFRVEAGLVETRDNLASLILFVVGLALLVGALYRGAGILGHAVGPDVTVLALIAVIYLVRREMVAMGIPATYFNSDIFDPKVFASSPINASMGDLFFNGLCVLILVIYLLRNYSALRTVRWLLHQSMAVRFFAGVTCLFMALLGVLLSYNFIEVIYHNSTQSLDITQSLSLSWVRSAAFLSVLIGTASAFLFMHMMLSLSRHFLPDHLGYFLIAVLAAGGLFMVQYELTGNNNLIPLLGGIGLLVSIHFFGFDRLDLIFSFRLFLYLILALTLFSVHHTLAVRLFHGERMVRDQFRYAKDFLTERDVLAEYLLDKASQRIASDPFIQTRMASPFFSRNSVVDKIRRVHINRYFDRYELSISTRGPTDSLLLTPGLFRQTGYPGIWYSVNTVGTALKQYHVSVPILYGRKVGYVELDLVLKRLLPDNVFPELLVDNRFSQLYRNRDFSYAVYREGRLANSFGVFNYERDFGQATLSNVALYREGIEAKGFNHVGIDEGDGSVAVVSAPDYSSSAMITNLSFWFVLGLVVLFTVQAVFGLIALARGGQVAFTARIQLYLFLAFALPMVSVSVIILTLMGRTSAEVTTREFVDRSVNVADRLAALSLNSEETDRLESWTTENANIVKTDISVYGPDGRIRATSQPSLFENQLLSEWINREAFERISLHGDRQTVTNEQIGTLQYNNAYAGVYSSQSGQLLAIVSLPFFESATYFQKGQLLVLSNILKVFVVAFLVFTLLSFLAADRLAFPFKFIARTLRQTSFTGSNKPLNWETQDEIGMLVTEYNRMVANLEESRNALARSEKESAWREMAKQVAHEIKNPLTPMKLTLQQMEQILDGGNVDREKVRKSVDVLLRQVEILNAIASSFSSFARMPAPSPQRSEMGKLLTDTVNLFRAGEDGRISFTPPDSPLWISVDPTSFSRAISNMLINAFQARFEGRELLVDLTVRNTGANAILEVHDNGRGIPENLRDRIFLPQFTTKDSGSGLGLFMVRQFVLQAGGRIWFESRTGEGTTFFIELPLTDTEAS